MINEYGERISINEIDLMVKRISNFSQSELDKLWAECNWVDNTKEKDNLSLPSAKLLLMNMHGHNLMRCVKCGKLLCDICAVIDSEGNPRCHDHGHSLIGLIIIAVVLLIICLIACC